MSVRLMADVFDAYGLTPTQKLVLLALADHANDEGRHVYPSVPLLSHKTALNERTVQIVLRELASRSLNLLLLVREGGGRSATEYRLNVEALKSLKTRGESDSPQGCTRFTAGVNLIHPSGESDSPLTIIEPPLNHQETPPPPDEQSLESVEPPEKKKTTPPGKKPAGKGGGIPFVSQAKDDPLKPSTPGSLYLFEGLSAEAREVSHRPPKRFETAAQRDTFLAAEKRLGPEAIRRGIDCALVSGITSRARIVQYLAVWTDKRNGNGHNGNGARPVPEDLPPEVASWLAYLKDNHPGRPRWHTALAWMREQGYADSWLLQHGVKQEYLDYACQKEKEPA